MVPSSGSVGTDPALMTDTEGALASHQRPGIGAWWLSETGPLAALLIVAVLVYLFCQRKENAAVEWILNFISIVCFVYAQISPYTKLGYSYRWDTPTLMDAILLFFGGLVGGFGGSLVPVWANSVALGCVLTALAFLAMPLTSVFASAQTIAISFGLGITVSCLVARRYPASVSLLRSSLSTAFLLEYVFNSFSSNAASASFGLVIIDLLHGQVNANHFTGSPNGRHLDSIIVSLLVAATLCAVKIIGLKHISLKDLFSTATDATDTNLAPKGYRAVPLTNVEDEESTSQAEKMNKLTMRLKEMQKKFRIPRSSGFNYFDSDALPSVLEPYFEEIIKVGEDLNATYGFQEDSCRNQCEHLLMMLTNEIQPSETAPASEGCRLRNRVSPVARLHARMFFNYRLWCERMSVSPAITANGLEAPLPAPVSSSSLASRKAPGSFALNGTDAPPLGYHNYLKELLLWLFIWGEAGNLKHLPECLCYLFHKTKTQKHHFPPGLYVGFYLDAVVSPLYTVIAKELSRKDEGNVNRKTYDDFNEFFWSPSCMEYSLLGEFDVTSTYASGKRLARQAQHVSVGLQCAKKTYTEKRSWLHPILSMRRVFQWHLLTFTMLAIWAFSESLVWEWYYTWQIMSFVFLELSVLNVLWTCLEIWLAVPYTEVSEASMYGYLLRLSWSYIVLVYQTLYFEWALQLQPGPPVGLEATGCAHISAGDKTTSCSNYWWWQYIWLSLIASSLYIVQCMLCYWPAVSSYVLTISNPYVQSIINIVYPTSQLYVGKVVHVPESEVFGYVLYWWTLIAFKLLFGYFFIIAPLTVPSLELYDDYMNFGNKFSFTKTLLLLFVWWFPHFLVYNIDLSIWYSVWSSLVGGSIAISAKLGVVANLGSIREKFYTASIACGKHLMPYHTLIAQEARGIMSSKENLLSLIKDNKQPMVKPSVVTIKSSARNGKAPLRSKSVNDFHVRAGGNPDSTTTAASTATHEQGHKHANGKPSTDLKAADYDNYSMSSHEELAHGVESIEKMKDASEPKHARDMQGLKDSLGNTEAHLKRSHIYSGWHIFSRIWNSIIQKLRERDYLSDAQRNNFQFTHFQWLRTPIYLPLFYTAGAIDGAIYAAESFAQSHKDVDKRQRALDYEDFARKSFDFPMREALKQSIELTEWILKTLLKDDDKAIATGFMFLNRLAHSSMGDLFQVFNMEKLKSIKDLVSSITRALLSCAKSPRGRDKPVVTEQKRKEYLEEKARQAERERELLGYKSTLKGIRKSQSTGCLQQTLKDYEAKEFSQGPVASGVAVSESRKSGKNVVADTAGALTNAAKANFNANIDANVNMDVSVFIKEHVLADPPRDRIREDIKKLFKETKSAFQLEKDSNKPDVEDAVRQIQFMLRWDGDFFTDDLVGSDRLDAFCKHPEAIAALSKLDGLLLLSQTAADDVVPEVVRRLTFFVNTMFMDMPEVPATRFVKEYTCVTPYYSEDVILSVADLKKSEADGVSTILYLKTLYKQEWLNFCERFGLKAADEDRIWRDPKLTQEVRLWASLRAQTLYRTVEGMMHVEKALELICELEEVDPSHQHVLPTLKFNYVVACQVYGTMKANMEAKANDIEYLLHKFPLLRVAYIDTVRKGDDVEYYSVLIKADRDMVASHGAPPLLGDKTLNIEEVFRIKLAGNPVLGEGKPENQNHALVFTRGRYLQAIDMNQDGYFEDALKMRNVLQEFDAPSSPGRPKFAILGLREHIFTGSVSNVANYMAMQELSFVTLGQRVLANPLHIRQHYGHPDIFDKMFVMTEGGMSKATKSLNLSEDVFAGFNATIRGHNVGFVEYVQIGKGRDVGLQQTYKFEAKLSQGNAEQSLSRDIYRICDRLDFFRLMSFYFGGIGHYVSSTLVMFTLVVVVYCMLSVAIFSEEAVNGRHILPEGVFQMLLAGLGILQTLPLAVTLVVENDGYVTALSELGFMIISGGPLYFLFQIETKCHYFSRSLMCGGAIYRPTGRGFVTEHSSFDDNYRYFASSHIYLGIELMAALLLYAHYTKSSQYAGLTWSLWMAVVSFVLGPFWFNPMTFEWTRVKADYKKWLRWMAERNGSPEQSWRRWWLEDNDCFVKLSISWKIWLFVQKCVLWSFIGFGVLGKGIWSSPFQKRNLIEMVLAMIAYQITGKITTIFRRSIGFAGAFGRAVLLFIPAALVCFLVYKFLMFPGCFLQLVALYYFASALAFMVLLCGGTTYVESYYKFHDYLVGNIIFFLLGILTTVQLGVFQTWILYHNALSQGVAVDEILSISRVALDKPSAASATTTSSSANTLLPTAVTPVITPVPSALELINMTANGASSNRETMNSERTPLLANHSSTGYPALTSQHLQQLQQVYLMQQSEGKNGKQTLRSAFSQPNHYGSLGTQPQPQSQNQPPSLSRQSVVAGGTAIPSQSASDRSSAQPSSTKGSARSQLTATAPPTPAGVALQTANGNDSVTSSVVAPGPRSVRPTHGGLQLHSADKK